MGLIFMPISQTQFLSELEAGHDGPPIPEAKRAYFQQLVRNSFFTLILRKFESSKLQGLTQAGLARRIGRSPEQISRWLGSPSNFTLDVATDLLLGISAEELCPTSSPILNRVEQNYSLFEELCDGANDSLDDKRQNQKVRGAESSLDSPMSNSISPGAAAQAEMLS
jgi:transcriptional regulator with XRE-family HTH domain